MEILLMVISIILIALGLLQSGKAESASGVISGGNNDLFSNRKERGGELLISRITFVTGALFMIVSFIISSGIIK